MTIEVKNGRLYRAEEIEGGYLDDCAHAALDKQYPTLRADAAGDGYAITASRALVREYAGKDSVRVQTLGTVLGYAKGTAGRTHQSLRADSYGLPYENTADGFRNVRVDQRRADLQAVFPSLQVASWASEFRNKYSEGLGSAGVYSGRVGEIPETEIARSQQKYPMEWIVTRVRIPWSDRPTFSRYSEDIESEKMAAGYANLAQAYEQVLRDGYAGLPGIANLPCPEVTIDVSTGTLEAQIAAFADGVERLREATNYEGDNYTTVVVHERILAHFRRQVAIDGGSSYSGLAALTAKLAEYGITNIRSTNRMPASKDGANYAMGIAFVERTGADLTSYGQLVRPVAVLPAPVSRAQFHGSDTILGMKVGGLVLPRSNDAGKMSVKLA